MTDRKLRVFNIKDEKNANKNMNEEWIDCIHAIFEVVLSNTSIRDPITTPKLLSTPIVATLAINAPIHIIHEKKLSFWTGNIAIVGQQILDYIRISPNYPRQRLLIMNNMIRNITIVSIWIDDGLYEIYLNNEITQKVFALWRPNYARTCLEYKLRIKCW